MVQTKIGHRALEQMKCVKKWHNDAIICFFDSVIYNHHHNVWMQIQFDEHKHTVGVARNFRSRRSSESRLLADAERAMQYWLNETWNICAKQSIGEAGFG